MAVTIDWVILGAAIIGLGVAVVSYTGDDDAAPSTASSTQSRTQTDTAQARSDRFTVTICSEHDRDIFFTRALYEEASDAGRTLAGWWTIEPGECRVVGSGSFANFSEAYVYYYAEDDRNAIWDGNAASSFCILNDRFERVLSGDYDCSGDERLVDFGEVTIERETPDYRLTLN